MIVKERCDLVGLEFREDSESDIVKRLGGFHKAKFPKKKPIMSTAHYIIKYNT